VGQRTQILSRRTRKSLRYTQSNHTNECAQSSVSDVQRYVIIIKLQDSISNILLVFIRRWKIQATFTQNLSSVKLPELNTWPCIDQEVSRRLPTAATRVRAQDRSRGICGGQSGSGAGFLRVLRFPLPILIPPTAAHSTSIIQGWYNRPISDRRTEWTQSHPTPRN
jgi:hypothetical protein